MVKEVGGGVGSLYFVVKRQNIAVSGGRKLSAAMLCRSPLAADLMTYIVHAYSHLMRMN